MIDYRKFRDTEDGMVFSGTMSMPGFMKIGHLDQKLIMEADALTLYINHILPYE
jgi:hypothetical protein